MTLLRSDSRPVSRLWLPATDGSAPAVPRQRNRGRSRPRLVLVVVMAALLLLMGCAFTLLAAVQADSGGYFSTAAHRFTTPTAALKSDEIEVGSTSAQAADPSTDIGELARVQVVVRAANPHTHMFVGIGPKDDVEAYLRGSSYDEFTSAELNPFRAAFHRVPGTANARNPADQPFWVATSAGAGTRTLTWNKTHGAWSVVIMRLTAEPGVDVDASIGLRFAFLLPSGIAMLTGGGLLLAFAWTRRRRTKRPAEGPRASDQQP
ncbi:hypothetical protein [Actinomadura sp. HBU206391]|uniref:hypothetical protein n=1 Tax=Actinomadura sp. HBU206391 TaxID=2731692 RepID=UPI00165095DB|nr:hypothetical protein [Actinomadura sp. HBU206391]MBC6460604.1 hypothetical protein [Actinomadura sp. HBU206391]